MADDQENVEAIQPAIPSGRVKRIMILDKDINRVTPEAVFLVSCSAELFLKFLAEKAADVAIEKKRKVVKLDFIRTAVKRHRPTSDFLLDSLPAPSQPSDRPATDKIRSRPAADKPVPAGTRRIDQFFGKSRNEKSSNPVNDDAPNPVNDEASNTAIDEASNPVDDEAPNPVNDEAPNPVSDDASNPVDDEASNPVNDEASDLVDNEASNPVNESDRLWAPLMAYYNRSIQGINANGLGSAACKLVRPLIDSHQHGKGSESHSQKATSKRFVQWMPVHSWLESLDKTKVVKSKEFFDWLSENPIVKEQLYSRYSRRHLMHYIQKCHSRMLKTREKGRGAQHPSLTASVKVNDNKVNTVPGNSSSTKALTDNDLYMARRNEAIKKYELLADLEDRLSILLSKFKEVKDLYKFDSPVLPTQRDINIIDT